ncbi:hypothetical protein KFL_002250010 [Klebsormidium nitens]|uniref:Dirigent protein n=1 Tax=Klebsormidium nitens TaxID=105231 RepID=A0A1Y1I7U8_KLENI|nr:hypothetical protein KFL_002250010 [Klebsormidium nitens]|eukprot:GAQ85221.1 hypothetical protein KFL_002250010 [Klebsormidium nitens]
MASRTVAAVLLVALLGAAVAPFALAAPPQTIIRVRGVGPTFKQGDYPNAVGTAKIFSYTAYDFYDKSVVYGQVTGKCDVVNAFSGGSVENCQYSFDFDAGKTRTSFYFFLNCILVAGKLGSVSGQIMVIGNVHTDYRPESFLALVGGTRSYREVTGQMQRRVIAADKRIFPNEDSENEYILALSA